jgi:hypothetical protein
MAILLVPLLLLAVQTATPAAAFSRHRGMFISPMGEPFRPTGRDDDTLADWFRQADRNHDGRLNLEEVQQDAARFFATLDIDHNGEIDPDEIARYETIVAPEISSGPHFQNTGFEGADSPSEGGGRHHSGAGHHRGGWNDSHSTREGGDRGAARFGLLDLPEPVVSADADFNRGVSPEEFREAAGQRFLALDLDHHGYLTLAGLEMIRPAPPAQPNKREMQAEGGSPPEN